MEVDGVTRDLTVIEPPGAVIRIVDLAISPSEVEVGNPVTVTATVVNEGDADDSTDVILLVRGQEIQRKLTLVRAGATVDVSFDPVISDEAGVYAVVVEVVKAEAPRTLGGSFTVAEKPEPPVEVVKAEAPRNPGRELHCGGKARAAGRGWPRPGVGP